MRPLIVGTSPQCNTGYATVVRNVARRLKALGHAPAVFAWNGHAGPAIDWGGVPIFGRGATITGHDVLAAHAEAHGADAILTVLDPWIQPDSAWREGHSLPVVHWFPCQSHPAPKALAGVCSKADAAWCYSRWGTRVMRAAGIDCRYVPLGVDTSVYRPMGRREARETMGLGAIGDRTLIGMVAANHSTVPVGRKAFDQALLAFADYKVEHDEDAILYLHTDPSPHSGGYELYPVIRSLGLRIGLDVIFPARADVVSGRFGDEDMRAIYSACNVVHQATCAEGFGLPILEAQACGVPVVVTHGSSMTELARHGATVRHAAQVWSPPPVSGWVDIPDVDSIRRNWHCLAGKPLARLAEAGRKFAEGFDWSVVVDELVAPGLAEVIEEAAPCPT